MTALPGCRWFPGQVAGNVSAEEIRRDLDKRLDLLAAANITVVAPVGPGNDIFQACDNIIAVHPAVIGVAGARAVGRARPEHSSPLASACGLQHRPAGALPPLLPAGACQPPAVT